MKAKQKQLLIFLTVFLAVSTITTNFIPTTQADITNGLVGYWPFNEGTGTTTYDYSGYNNTGTITNPYWSIGKIGSALVCNSTTVTVNANSVLQPTALSIAFWIYPTGTAATPTIIHNNGEDYAIYMADYSASKYTSLRYFYWSNIGAATTIYFTVNIPTNNWSHIAITISQNTGSDTAKCYINSVLVDTQPVLSIRRLNSANTYFGAGYAGTNNFNGTLDDLRLYNRALSATDVLELYYYPASVPSPTPATYPSSTPIASPVFLTSINSNPLWQYLYAWDFAGFVIATWTFSLGQSFFVIIAFIVSLAIYIRYQNLVGIKFVVIVDTARKTVRNIKSCFCLAFIKHSPAD